ncbi:hypothetical protein CLV71_101438 [Actinophytocola oryzae]|uniref:Uncharacterized protein n=1 Tax=Actinophytocola oryzae TaxID=502181 RepID=A0A4R7W768_9PSEU|nr:hypothetical protein CLV71_101438 [Actinophytocola oryzae]
MPAIALTDAFVAPRRSHSRPSVDPPFGLDPRRAAGPLRGRGTARPARPRRTFQPPNGKPQVEGPQRTRANRYEGALQCTGVSRTLRRRPSVRWALRRRPSVHRDEPNVTKAPFSALGVTKAPFSAQGRAERYEGALQCAGRYEGALQCTGTSRTLRRRPSVRWALRRRPSVHWGEPNVMKASFSATGRRIGDGAPPPASRQTTAPGRARSARPGKSWSHHRNAQAGCGIQVPASRRRPSAQTSGTGAAYFPPCSLYSANAFSKRSAYFDRKSSGVIVFCSTAWKSGSISVLRIEPQSGR